MDVYTFRRHDTLRGRVANPTGSISTRRAINFRGRHITLSGMLAAQLGVKAGSHLAFAYDENKPENIYMRTADYPDDTRDIQCPLTQINSDKAALQCSNTAFVKHVLEQVGATKSCTCYVAPEPTEINGRNHYQILVSCPIHIR